MLLALLSHSSSQDFKCSVRLCCSLSQQNPWITFISPAAWKRTKSSLCRRAALDGYKWDCPSCQQQALRPLPCSAEPSKAAVPAHLEAQNLRAAVSPATVSNCSLLPDNSVNIRKLYSACRNTVDKATVHRKSLKVPVKNTASPCGNKVAWIIY